MLINLLFKLQKQNQCLSWEDYYEDEQYKTISYKITQNSIDQLEIEESTDVYIYRCLFTDCSTESYGGVLSFTKTNGKLLIEYSIFEECHSKNEGGVVYVYGKSDCVINSICSYKCYATNNYGQFIYTELQNDKKNYVRSSSICSTYKVYGYRVPIYLEYGFQKCKSVNISNYNVSSTSAIYYSGSNTISNITYCSIVSNHAVGCSCVTLASSSSTYLIESSNIINNSQQDFYNGWSTIGCVKYTEIKHSNIIDNKSQYLFDLTSSRITVTIDDTFIKHGTNTLKTGIGSLDTKGQTYEIVEIEKEFIDCIRLENRFRITSDVYYYVLFLNFIRASLLPSIYI